MIITMRQPVKGSLRNSGSTWYFVKTGNSWVRKYDVLKNLPGLKARIELLLSTERTPQRFSGDYFGSDDYHTKGEASPKRPNFYQDLPKIRVNNKPYLVQKNNGNIVVSDYQTGQLRWTFKNGGPTKKIGDPWTRSCDLLYLNLRHGLYKIGYVLDNQVIMIDDNTAVMGAIAYDVQEISTDDSKPPNFSVPETGWLLNQLVYDTDLITKTTGEANRKSVDVLTALAEAPETIKDALGAATTILKMYREAKQGEFRLVNKTKRLRLEYDEALRSLSRQLRNEELSKRKYQLRKKQLKNDFVLSMKELTDAIAQVWLTFRYGIMPNVYLIEGINKAVDTRKNVFFEFTSTNTRNLNLLDGFTGNIEVKDKAFIKRKFVKGQIYNSLSANPFLTAWELIPLSFVVDWVINIGNLLSTLVNPSEASMLQEGATYSWKLTGAMVKSFDDGSSVTCEIRGYKRNVINPGDLCGLTINPDFSLVRQLDALALSWNLALKKLYRK